MVGARAHHDHRAAVGALGVAGELAGDAGDELGVDAGDLLLPGGRVGLGVVEAGGPVARQALARHAELGGQQVEDRRDQVAVDAPHRDAAAHRPAALGLADVEARQVDGDGLAGVHERDGRAPRPRGRGSTAPRPRRPSGSRWSRSVRPARPCPCPTRRSWPRRSRRLAEVGGREEGAGHVGVAALLERHQEGQVGEAAGVVGEVRRLALDVELAQDHVASWPAQARRRCPAGRPASGRRTWCGPSSPARPRRSSGPCSAPRS